MAEDRKTVVQVVQDLRVGGLERMVVTLVDHMDDKRFRSVLVCLGDGGPFAEELEQTGHEVHRLGKKDGVELRMIPKLRTLFKRESADIVHCHNDGPLLYGSLASRFSGKGPVLYTAHGVQASRFLARLPFHRLGLVRRAIAVSEHTRSVMLDEAGFPARKTITIVNGLDGDRFVTGVDREEKRRGVCGAGDGPLLGIVARLAPEKDHATLFEALVGVKSAFPRVKLLVIGDGPLSGPLHDKRSQLGLDDNVVFLGSRSDVPELLAVLDAFVLSSTSEGLSLTLLEAMAAGRPIVATRVGGNPEVVVDGETGLLVPAGDPRRLAEAITSVLETEGLADRMGQAGRQRVGEAFSVRRMVGDYESLYAEVLEGAA